ncbi:MAG TPA: PRTRC system protein F [Flavobacteriales bacterium]|nr:PRTRC system protein F [Flavobacteriales bacterium]
MRTSLATLGAPVSSNRGPRRSLSGGRFRPGPDPLSLPQFGKGLTISLNPSLDVRRWAMLALRWLEVGELPESASGLPPTLVQQALVTWINRMVGQLQHIGFEAHVAASPAALGYGSLFPDASEDDDQWYWAIQSEQVEWLGMKDRLTRIETLCPGLGETALYWLQRASGRTLYALTPQSARDLCEYIHWQGSSDQAEWLDEMRSMGMTEEDLGDAISPDWYDGHFPDWVLRAKPVLDEEALSRIQSSMPEVAPVAAVLLDIEQLMADGGQLPGLDGMEVESVYFGAYLRWDADDPMDRVFDDFIEYANCASDGYTDLFGAGAVPLDAEGFHVWLHKTGLGLQLLSSLDRLIALIAEPL